MWKLDIEINPKIQCVLQSPQHTVDTALEIWASNTYLHANFQYSNGSNSKISIHGSLATLHRDINFLRLIHMQVTYYNLQLVKIISENIREYNSLTPDH